MKVTYQWLKDFVEIKILPQALAEKLTMAGLEVTSLEEKHGDSVFEIEITSNRPDWLSVIGVAREVAAITNKKMKLPKLKSLRPSAKSGQFSLTVEDKKDCPLYSAKIIRGVKVAPSPDWLKKRLELVGCRSVNNVVDITNYILFEYGEPLHAFDLDKLNNGAIIVRRAKHTEKITTIDAGQRALNPNLLVIADKEKPVAIAGIMGGRDTEVTEGTKNILLEAAIFNPVLIRRARQALGLTSESAYRFERGVSPGIVEEAAARAVELIQSSAQANLLWQRVQPCLRQKEKALT
jgi:phenylalanyl-tRNA synthetase beta chain